jgi:iron complex outermembrane receptor protein
LPTSPTRARRRDYTGEPITIGTGVTTNWTANGPGAVLPDDPADRPSGQSVPDCARFGRLPLRQPARRSSVLNEGKRLLAGVRGTNFGWDWESALLWNRADNESTQLRPPVPADPAQAQ